MGKINLSGNKLNRVSIYCTKVSSSMVFNDDGDYEHVTLLSSFGNVTFLNKICSDGEYSKINAYFPTRGKMKKPQLKQIEPVLLDRDNEKKSGFIREIIVPNQINDSKKIDFSMFDGIKSIDIIGISKGKGFSGVMKKHNFRGLRASHGVSKKHRSQGSTGQCQDPGRINKGKKMAGRLGNDRVTVQNIKILFIDVVNGIMLVKGATPGFNGSCLYIRRSIKNVFYNNIDI